MLADVRQDLERLLAEAIAQVAGHAVEQRIAAGHDDHALPAEQGAQLGDGFLQVGAQRPALGGHIGQQRQHRLGAEDDLGRQEQVAGASGQARQAVAADANDVNARWLGHGGSSPEAVGSQMVYDGSRQASSHGARQPLSSRVPLRHDEQ